MIDPNFDHVTTERRPIHKAFDAITIALFIVTIILLVLNWTKLPDTVPIHFNIKGEADGWGSKYTLFFLPVLTVALFTFLTFLEGKPHIFNLPVKITEQNMHRQFAFARTIMNVMKNLCTILMSFIVLSTVFDAKQTPIPYSNVIIFSLIGLLIVSTLYMCIRSYQLK